MNLKIAILGGGPSALFFYKRLLESPQAGNVEVDIYEKHDRIGCGMPYGHGGAADEHITNVSGNEIPALVDKVSDWVRRVPKDTLNKYHIDPARFNEYKVLPRLLFGQYLCDQFGLLLECAKEEGMATSVYYHTPVTDIIDEPDSSQVIVKSSRGEQVYDRVIVCTGHLWPKKHEGEVPGWCDSPYPPEKIAQRANYPVAVRGASLTAIDAIRTLARHNGKFEKDEEGKLVFTAAAESPDFRVVMHSRNGLLPAVRFHLKDSHLGKGAMLSDAEIAANREINDGFLSLDYVFEKHFKEEIQKHDAACYAEISNMNMEAFVEHMLSKRENCDPFELLKAEYKEAEHSIARQKSVYWKEALAELSFMMNYPAKYFSAEDMLRLQKTLMPLISVIIAFVPQSSAETLMALHDAGRLTMVEVAEGTDPQPAENGGANYNSVYYPLFVDAIGQPHLSFEDIPFEGLKKIAGRARLQFHDQKLGRNLFNQNDKEIIRAADEKYYLPVPGVAINDHFQLLDDYNALNERVYIMAVPFIGGFNPDYSGLDFGEAASILVLEGLAGTALAKGSATSKEK